jgi:small subunit ribosomal protein S18
MSEYKGNRFYTRSKVCQFCTDKSIKIDYKNADLLRRYVDDTGKIRPRRQTGTCAKHQREVAKAIKNARHIALLPFSGI